MGDRDLILGASERIAPYMRSWNSPVSNPGSWSDVSADLYRLAGEDIQDVIQRAAKDLPIPVLFVPTPGFKGICIGDTPHSLKRCCDKWIGAASPNPTG